MASLGRGYEEYVRDNILVPLGMDRTGFALPEGVRTGDRLPAAVGPLTPLLGIALPGGIVGPRQGRYASFNSFYVKGAPTAGWSAASPRPPGSSCSTWAAARWKAGGCYPKRRWPRCGAPSRGRGAGLRAGSTRTRRRGGGVSSPSTSAAGAGFWNVILAQAQGARLLSGFSGWFPLSK